jgi:hypothetical protein
LSKKLQKEGDLRTMRSLVINRILSFQYRLGKLIGKRKAARICIVLEETFTRLFGREVYNDIQGKRFLDSRTANVLSAK